VLGVWFVSPLVPWSKAAEEEGQMLKVVVSFISKIVLGVVTAVVLSVVPVPESFPEGGREAAAFSAAALCFAWSIKGNGGLSQVLRVVAPIALMCAGMADPWVRECPRTLSEGVLPFVNSVATKVEQGAHWVRERSSTSNPAPPST